MQHRKLIAGVGVLCLALVGPLRAADEGPSARRAAAAEVYAAPAADEVRARAVEWVASKQADEELLGQIGELWAAPDEELSARDLFDRLIETFALADPETRTFVEACRFVDAPLVPPEPTVLEAADESEFYTANMRLFYARYLTQRKMYDEALDVFAGLEPALVVDPASLLFHRAVCEHQLVMKDDGLATIGRLLKNTERVPSSYSTVATLMQHDLESLTPQSLGQISRKMRDSERRLELARGGQRVQKVQGEIIAELDELIQKLEEQSGGGGGGGGAGGGSGQNSGNQSSSPADESRVKGSTAPGDVDERRLSNQGGWGQLPPKDEARAKQEIERNFPPQYRAAIEEYFRRQAERQQTER